MNEYQEISPGVCVDNYQNRVDCKTGKIIPYTPPSVQNTAINSAFSTFGNQNTLTGASDENSIFSNNTFNPSINIQGELPKAPVNPELSKYYKIDESQKGIINDLSINSINNKASVKSNSKYYPYIAPIAALNTGLAYFSELKRQSRSKEYEQNNLSNPYNGILGYNTAKQTYDVSGSPFTNYYNYKKGGLIKYPDGGKIKANEFADINSPEYRKYLLSIRSKFPEANIKGIDNTYGKYNNGGVEGINNPTELQQIINMTKYMKHNSPYSNIYRDEYHHYSTETKPNLQIAKKGGSYKKKMEEGGDYLDEYLDDYLNEDDSKKKTKIDNSAPSEQELEDNDLWEQYNNDLANNTLSLLYERKNKSYTNDDDKFLNDSPSSNNEASLKINQVSQKYGVPPSLLYGVWGAESGFGKVGVNKENSAGAKGHFQFTKETAKQYGLENREDFDQSLDASARYFSDLYKKFGNWNLALAGYNSGPGNVIKYKGVPPFKETRNYIKKVNKYASQY